MTITALTNANLSDGGHSENLAAYSLIRRGVKKIIIVDAGHDPNYEFLDYSKLKNHLSLMGVDFYVEDIEKFLETRKKKEVYVTASVSEGYAKSRPTSAHKTPIDSRIYYVKMSKPKSIFAGKLQDTAAYDRGEEYSIERREKLEDSGWDCNSDSVANYGFRSDMYIYTVKNYSEYLNRHWLWRKVGKKIPFFRYNFPQTTTMEQSFYRDQLEAFVGLGYLQALELEKHRDW